jgi:proliferating cell nuclear antigen
MSITSKNILFFKIEDITSFKTMIETLSKVVSETTWILHNPKDKQKFIGLEINTADSSRSIFIKIQISSDEFLEFDCKNERYQLGINLEKLNKMIKFVEKEDKLNIFLNEKDISHLIIEIERATTKGKKTLKIPLMNLEYEDKPTKKIDYEKIISTTPNIYKKIFRELDDFENVKINCTNKKILFVYKDDLGTEINDEYILDSDGINIENFSSPKEFVGTYPIKYLVLFVKCANLCEELEIYMKTEFTLTVKFPTISFGTIIISLSPINDECVKNVEYDYSEDEDTIDVIGNNTSKLYYDD